MAKHKIGIVGFGKIARDQHAPAIAASNDFELAAISNIGSGSAPPGVPSFASPQEMLKGAPELDCVAICTPPGPRRIIALECLEAGKNVLLEKPPAATVAEVGDIGARASLLGKVAFATYHAQHNAAVKLAADHLSNKTVTKLLVTWIEDIRQWHPGEDWILAEGGFGIFDPGINALSVLTRILPQPLFIHEAELLFPSNRQAPIAANLVFSLGSTTSEEMKAQLDWRRTGPPTWEIDIATADGFQLKLSDGGSKLEVQGEPSFAGPADEYPDIYREFAELLETGTSKADAAPFQLVADAFMLGGRTTVEPFEF